MCGRIFGRPDWCAALFGATGSLVVFLVPGIRVAALAIWITSVTMGTSAPAPTSLATSAACRVRGLPLEGWCSDRLRHGPGWHRLRGWRGE